MTEELGLAVVYEDADVMVLNKPAGVVVNRSQTWSEATIQDWLALRQQEVMETEAGQTLLPINYTDEFGTAAEIFKERLGVAHRLDKETSGALLVAKNPGALINLLDQFKKRIVHKSYLALVHGVLSIKEDRLNLPLGRRGSNRLRWAVRPDGREAITDYRVIQEWRQINLEKLWSKLVEVTERGRVGGSGGRLNKQWSKKVIENLYQGFSLIECRPKTGRTHQIRVHLAHLKHPLVGDEAYGSAKKIRLDQYWCPRHFLHAAEIQFVQPRSGELVKVTVELPADLRTVLGYLE